MLDFKSIGKFFQNWKIQNSKSLKRCMRLDRMTVYRHIKFHGRKVVWRPENWIFKIRKLGFQNFRIGKFFQNWKIGNWKSLKRCMRLDRMTVDRHITFHGRKVVWWPENGIFKIRKFWFKNFRIRNFFQNWKVENSKSLKRCMRLDRMTVYRHRKFHACMWTRTRVIW